MLAKRLPTILPHLAIDEAPHAPSMLVGGPDSCAVLGGSDNSLFTTARSLSDDKSVPVGAGCLRSRSRRDRP